MRTGGTRSNGARGCELVDTAVVFLERAEGTGRLGLASLGRRRGRLELSAGGSRTRAAHVEPTIPAREPMNGRGASAAPRACRWGSPIRLIRPRAVIAGGSTRQDAE